MILIPQGKEFRCPKCHAHISAKPPPACRDCGVVLEKPRQAYRLGVDQRLIDDLRRQVSDLQDELASLRQHQAGMVDAGLLQEVEREVERLQEKELILVAEAGRQVVELNNRTGLILKRQGEIQRLKRQSEKLEVEIERLTTENADLLFAFRVQIADTTPRTDNERRAVARAYEKARTLVLSNAMGDEHES
jgi:hypothetical protein